MKQEMAERTIQRFGAIHSLIIMVLGTNFLASLIALSEAIDKGTSVILWFGGLAISSFFMITGLMVALKYIHQHNSGTIMKIQIGMVFLILALAFSGGFVNSYGYRVLYDLLL